MAVGYANERYFRLLRVDSVWHVGALRSEFGWRHDADLLQTVCGKRYAQNKVEESYGGRPTDGPFCSKCEPKKDTR